MFEELGISSIRIDLPFRLDHVNCFLAEGNNGWIIIDAGLNDKKTEDRWSELIAGKHVTDLLITHYHPDHFGLAGGLQEMTGARVSMSKTDINTGMYVWEKDFTQEIFHNYVLAGIPEKTAIQMTSNTESFLPSVTPYPCVTHYFKEGEKIRFGRYEYEVIFTPGHSDGLVVFYNRERNVLLSTDHILPSTTPNISYWFHGIRDPLGTYLASLNKIKKLNADFVIPSHGQPFYGANDRVDEILAHHDKRLQETIDSIGSGETIYEVCSRVFNRQLSLHETRFALGETIAHLEYLRGRGELGREMKGKYWSYFKV
ncbi:MBL fold metallo-hydrolase [Salicibibacter kimchii]|uniref:MBL fold metallo-hydrolase n=1 Tax=Salicibibacter kimchii TaxID=2099786 RepID=A0A345BW41_9BACI|nr:MBL fold metallo-hydrolase [Salicibibacter kimchii]AXF55172.1 MBL fold metallo-hydrolase [Salicibibacter kimchii]